MESQRDTTIQIDGYSKLYFFLSLHSWFHAALPFDSLRIIDVVAMYTAGRFPSPLSYAVIN